jgi:hypothetical protein
MKLPREGTEHRDDHTAQPEGRLGAHQSGTRLPWPAGWGTGPVVGAALTGTREERVAADAEAGAEHGPRAPHRGKRHLSIKLLPKIVSLSVYKLLTAVKKYSTYWSNISASLSSQRIDGYPLDQAAV